MRSYRRNSTRSGPGSSDRNPGWSPVIESSGHYWFKLASHLRRRSYLVAVVNPLEAKYFAESPDQPLLRRELGPARIDYDGLPWPKATWP